MQGVSASFIASFIDPSCSASHIPHQRRSLDSRSVRARIGNGWRIFGARHVRSRWVASPGRVGPRAPLGRRQLLVSDPRPPACLEDAVRVGRQPTCSRGWHHQILNREQVFSGP